MRERPILYSGEMVRATLDGRKTKTRRIIKPQPIYNSMGTWIYGGDIFFTEEDMGIHLFHNVYGNKGTPFGSFYSDGGDHLWVKETFCDMGAGTMPGRIQYRATFTDLDQAMWHQSGYSPIWKPSIFMPRWASRIDLTITQVKVERLQDITEEEAWAEGVGGQMGPLDIDGRVLFRGLWNSLYAKPKPVYRGKGVIDYYESYPWEDIHEMREYRGKPWNVIGNPWVWAISFNEKKPEEE